MRPVSIERIDLFTVIKMNCGVVVRLPYASRGVAHLSYIYVNVSQGGNAFTIITFLVTEIGGSIL